jgi:hypothetical protein
VPVDSHSGSYGGSVAGPLSCSVEDLTVIRMAPLDFSIRRMNSLFCWRYSCCTAGEARAAVPPAFRHHADPANKFVEVEEI